MSVRYPLLLLWLSCAVLETASMVMAPGSETVAYHLIWIGLALAHDREVWPWRITVAAVVVTTTVTGFVMVLRVVEGVLHWEETTEIPLMTALLLLVLWNSRRRAEAMDALRVVHERDRRRGALRVRLSRLTSHEMRTPATIAQGFTDLLLARETDEQSRHDLEVIHSELGRLVLASDRLVRMMRMPEQDGLDEIALADLLQDTTSRWHVVAERRWVVEADPISLACSPDRLRACLDTLIENAVRYTSDSDTVRVTGRRHGGLVLIGVGDSGPGLSAQAAQSVNLTPVDADHLTFDSGRVTDPLSQSGLGLHLVREAAAARGGRLLAGRSADGGALLVMALPATPATSVWPPAAAAADVGAGMAPAPAASL
jgi:signal transduction histidine kinase